MLHEHTIFSPSSSPLTLHALPSMPPVLPLTIHKADSTSGSFHATKPAFASLPLFLLLAPLLLPDLSRQAQLVTLIYYSLTSCAHSGIWSPTTEGGCDTKLRLERWHWAEAMGMAHPSVTMCCCIPVWTPGLVLLSFMQPGTTFSFLWDTIRHFLVQTNRVTSLWITKRLKNLLNYLRNPFLLPQAWTLSGSIEWKEIVKATERLFECLIELEMWACSCWAGAPHQSCASGHFW